MDERQYLLKIRLMGIEPEIWRRFVVPGFISLDRLHDVIQVIMGWQDYHLYEFTISGKKYVEDPESKEEGLVDGKYRLADLIKAKGSSFQYLYDFGDWWVHEIMVEDSRYATRTEDADSLIFGKSWIECLGGARACPPEDVGGISGYYEFCEAIKNPKHKEHRAMKEWISSLFPVGKGYDSEKFDLEAVNYELLKYIRWSRPRYM
jgi:hypothetical protein